jgi:hypothetical protein
LNCSVEKTINPIDEWGFSKPSENSSKSKAENTTGKTILK